MIRASQLMICLEDIVSFLGGESGNLKPVSLHGEDALSVVCIQYECRSHCPFTPCPTRCGRLFDSKILIGKGLLAGSPGNTTLILKENFFCVVQGPVPPFLDFRCPIFLRVVLLSLCVCIIAEHF